VDNTSSVDFQVLLKLVELGDLRGIDALLRDLPTSSDVYWQLDTVYSSLVRYVKFGTMINDDRWLLTDRSWAKYTTTITFDGDTMSHAYIRYLCDEGMHCRDLIHSDIITCIILIVCCICVDH
jgi:hypothetical protein